MPPWYRDTTTPSYHATMTPWYHGATVSIMVSWCILVVDARFIRRDAIAVLSKSAY